jgi:uncharacterized protein YdaU (DUF1376 family)
VSAAANSLYWFPHDPAKWRVRTGHLSPEARGAYAELRNVAWEAVQNGRPACTVPDDDVQLARLSAWGPRWKRIAAEVRSLYTERADGQLFDTDLYILWDEQQAAYRKRASAGRKGGKAKALQKPGSSIASDSRDGSASNAVALQKHLELELETALERTLTGPALAPVAPDGLPAAPDGAGMPGAEERLATAAPAPGWATSRISRSAILARRAVTDADRREQQGVVDAWCAEHPDAAAALRDELAREFKGPGGIVAAAREMAFRAAVQRELEAVEHAQALEPFAASP